MPSVDFENLTRPISATSPCGPDLDAEGHIDFLNFFASVESVLPQSYFRARDPESGETRLFDPKMIAFDRYFEDAKPFVEKTRDIRLTVMLAKLSILNRDLNGFVACVKALATLLVLYWDEVHPKGEGGDYAYRGIALEALDVAPTVTMPLQFLALVNDRRIGSVSYRNHLTATGAVPPAEGEPTLDVTAVERVLDTCELDILIDIHSKFQDILGATRQLREVWSEKNASGEALSFDQLATEAGAIAKWLGDTINRRSPGFGVDEAAASTGGEEDGELAKTTSGVAPSGPIKSAAQAVAALNAVARYYAAVEPSSPARLLICLSQQMIGKTFAEIVGILAPNYVEQAAIKIGTGAVLDLPIVRMAESLDGIATEAASGGEEAQPEYTIGNRAQALAIIDQISAFFRISEPSSPVPTLLERIRDLGQRDFLYLLRSVLPADALKPPEA
jgi:type VI secretion system protein ImpA